MELVARVCRKNLKQESQILSSSFIGSKLNLPASLITCKGCRAQNGCPMMSHECETLAGTKEKKVTFCFQCDEFPCDKLMPAAEQAAKFPHNLKLYNLNRIQKVGVNQWAKEESKEIRERYFKGKFVLGSGPLLNDDEK